MGTGTQAKRCMKRSSRLAGKGGRRIALSCVWLGLACAPAMQAQTLGQQVSPQPMGSYGAPQSTGAIAGGDVNGQAAGQATGGSVQQQVPSIPTNVPGTGPMNDSRVGVFGTGSDIPQTSPTTQISDGDLLDIVIFETPELSGRFRVNMKGDILLPLAGALHVEGLTLAEITDAVAERYKAAKILVDPQVTVFVAEFTRRTITISGEVRVTRGISHRGAADTGRYDGDGRRPQRGSLAHGEHCPRGGPGQDHPCHAECRCADTGVHSRRTHGNSAGGPHICRPLRRGLSGGGTAASRRIPGGAQQSAHAAGGGRAGRRIDAHGEG